MVNYDGTGEDEVAPPLRPPPPPTLLVVSDAAQVLAQANQLMLKKIAHFPEARKRGITVGCTTSGNIFRYKSS